MPKNWDNLLTGLMTVIPFCAVLVVLLIVSWYVLRVRRVYLAKTELRPTDYLESFRKLHEGGELSKEEFRIIRGLLSLQVSRHPDDPQNNPRADFSLLNKHSPSLQAENTSGNFPKK
jgi:hypothetical protein